MVGSCQRSEARRDGWQDWIVTSDRRVVFVFEPLDPPSVRVYEGLRDVMDCIESLDVDPDEVAFTETGQVVAISATTDGDYAHAELTNAFDEQRIRRLLRKARGPDALKALAGDPIGYANEWLWVDDWENRRMPMVPRWLHERRDSRVRPESGPIPRRQEE